MGQEYRLSPLEMGVAGHGAVAVFLRPLNKRGLHDPDLLSDGSDLIPEVEADIEDHLVVPGATRVEFSPDLPDLFDEAALDIHMDVFQLDSIGKRPLLELPADLAEPLENRLDLGLGQDVGLTQGPSPRLRALKVVRPEAVIKRQGSGEALGGWMGGIAETPTPRFIGHE
jgi:hypothetical protein